MAMVTEAAQISSAGVVEPHMQADRVSIAYATDGEEGQLLAVEDLDFHINRGEFVCIVGPSGCGKTTFLDAVAGFLPTSSGSIVKDGKPVVKPGPDRAMVFQQPNLLPWRRVRQNVSYGLEMAGILGRKDAEARADELLALVGLSEFAMAWPRRLSGGMRQRVNLARALAVSPDLLLLDEPFASVDAQARETLQAELMRIRAEASFSALFVTHDISEAVFLGDRVCVFSPRPGRVAREVLIDLPVPRTAAARHSSEFISYTEEISLQLMSGASRVGRQRTDCSTHAPAGAESRHTASGASE